jgi:hypothetical protein
MRRRLESMYLDTEDDSGSTPPDSIASWTRRGIPPVARNMASMSTPGWSPRSEPRRGRRMMLSSQVLGDASVQLECIADARLGAVA